MRPLSTLLLVAALAACSSSSTGTGGGAATDACAGADPDACFSDHYLHGAAAEAEPTCDTGSKNAIHGKRRLVFHTSSSSGDAAAVAEGRSLQRYFAPYDLQFSVDQPATFVGFENAIEGDVATVEARARAEGLDVASPTPAQTSRLRAITGDVLAANMKSFIASVSSPPTSDVHVVVLSQIFSASLAKELQLKGTIVGLGLSPKLLRDVQAGDANKNLFELFGLPAEFTPVLFIGYADLARLTTPTIGEVVVAHELGHAMGLQHTTDPKNLMYPQADAQTLCLPTLSDAQVTGLAAVATKIDATIQRADGAALVGDLFESVSRRVQQRAATRR